MRQRTTTLLATLCITGALGSSTALAIQDGSDVPRVGDPGGPGRFLDPVEREQWLRGRRLFDQPMHRSRGLGAPEMNADSCRGCHQDPAVGGAGGLELNVSRMGRNNSGVTPFMDVPGGQGLSKLRPPFHPGREEAPDTADVFEQRQTPSILGDGLIDAIPAAEILANEDPLDLDGDGIRGVARRISVGGVTEVGRFGWKAQVPRLADFVRDAAGGELGMTTSDDGRGFALIADADVVADPELSDAEVLDMAFFLLELGPPLRVDPTAQEVLTGEFLFHQIGCATCHVPSLMGPAGPVPLYSDLLLHDVAPSSYEGMAEPGADVGVFRTPPLWGIRDTAPYMHDGSAETLRRAINVHRGEATAAQQAYQALSPADRTSLIAFLEDL